MVRTFSLAAFLFASSFGLVAAEPIVVKLWPGKAPGETKDIGPETYVEAKGKQDKVTRLTNVSDPTLTVYLPAKDKANGTGIIVAPGGAYRILAMDHEGKDVCKWLNDLGVTAFLLKYRVPKREMQTPDNLAAIQDGQRAVSLVRSRAAEWGVDPNRVGFLGISAGGNLAASTGLFEKRYYDPVDAADKASTKPAFMMLIYPGYLADKGVLKPEYAATKDTPPTFLAGCADDAICNESLPLMYLSMKKANVPVELHIYGSGGHGFGMKKIPHPAATWSDRCGEWMQSRGLLKPAAK